MKVEALESNLTDIVVSNYEGDYDEETGEYTGQAVAKLDNETQYEGVFQKGLFHGKGKFTWSDGVSYEGEFKLNALDGKGTYTYADGSVYVGDISDGKRHGHGKLTTSAGQVYEGDWKDGMRHGKGKMSYTNEKAVTYTGEWVENNREGYGVMLYPSENIYEGEWKTDRKAGYGTMIWKELDEVYTGQWRDDLPHGFGEHVWGESTIKTLKRQTCNIYRGEFVQGKRQGKGTFFYANGAQYTGYWENNAKHGIGVYLHVDNRISVGHYVENKLVSGEDTQNMLDARDTGDITPQFFLNIMDILTTYPNSPFEQKPLAPNSPSATISSTVSAEETLLAQRKQYVQELERLILKYNQYIKNVYKRYVELAIRDRQRTALVLPARTHYSTDNKYTISMAAIKARNVVKRFHCMSIDTIIRFLRDIGLIDEYFNVEDVHAMYKQMRKNKLVVILQLYRTFITKTLTKEAEANGLTDFLVDNVTLQEYTVAANLSVGDLLDAYLDPLGHDTHFSTQAQMPILEHEFVELLVRVVNEAYARRGKVNVDLYQILSKILHGKILLLLTEGDAIADDLTRTLYLTPIQDLLKNRPLPPSNHSAVSPSKGSAPSRPPLHQSMSSAQSLSYSPTPTQPLAHAANPVACVRGEDGKVNRLEKVWEEMREKGGPAGKKRTSKLLHGGSVYGETLRDHLLSLRGDVVNPALTPTQLTSIIFPSAPASPDAEDMWARWLSYEDYIENMCKLMLSDQWGVPEVVVDKVEGTGAGVGIVVEGEVAADVPRPSSAAKAVVALPSSSSSASLSPLQVKLLQFLHAAK